MDTTNSLMTPAAYLEHWQGHRRLTRRTIEAFPEDKLFSYSAGGMRSFGELALEVIAMAVPLVKGIASGQWNKWDATGPSTKADLLSLWDAQTEPVSRIFATISADRWQTIDKAFGQWEMTCLQMLLYTVDNEIHHRGQGYVYLRELGIEPPPFWERS